ncbi:conserved protein, unknown function [Hepatocystis sp. ex Piliocolobus tephrosceles]|nr:conserved protein, unknown function [Hepatocystis sp. ex Piliocolobus tephrosceles]
MPKKNLNKKQDAKNLDKNKKLLNKKTKGAEKKNVEIKKKDEKPPTILRWIELLRNLKLKQLKHSINEEMNNYEINKNINDKLLIFLNDNLEENMIIEKIDELKNSKLSVLVDIHKENMNNLQKQFEEQVFQMFNDFEEDEKTLIQNRDSIIRNINLYYKQLTDDKKMREENLKKEELEMLDEIYKNYIAEKYISNYKFEKFKEEDDQNFNNLLIENKKLFIDECTNYDVIQKKCEKSKQNLLSKEKEVRDLELKIDNWKLKLENEIKIYEMQIERLKNEKTSLLNHIKAIKLILQKLKHNDKQRLIDIAINSSKCINKLEENILIANKLIATNNLCKKYETERERLL